MTVECYQLIEINVDAHRTNARPIEWDGKDYDGQGHDQNGRMIQPIAYASTCPYCGQLMHLWAKDLIFEGDNLYQAIHAECKVHTFNRSNVFVPSPPTEEIEEVEIPEVDPDLYVLVDEEDNAFPVDEELDVPVEVEAEIEAAFANLPEEEDEVTLSAALADVEELEEESVFGGLDLSSIEINHELQSLLDEE